MHGEMDPHVPPSQSKPWGCLFFSSFGQQGKVFHTRGLGIHNNILAKRKEAPPTFGSWEILIKYSGRALHPSYFNVYHIKVGPEVPGSVSRHEGGGITELDLFTMPIHS